MNQYSLTKSRTLQWIVIIFILAVLSGAYWYWSVRGATKFGTDRASEKVLSSLVGYWPFDGGDVSFSDLTAVDRSGSGNNGTLTNFDPPQPSASGLIGLWPMDTADISGATVYDRSGSGNNGTGAFLATSSAQAFAYTGASQTYTVPAGVTSITIKSWGAGGGGAASVGTGGAGGYATGVLSVTPGEALNVYVGGAGLYNGSAGYNGGGATANTGGSGGGGTDVRQGGTALSNRVIVAGGGAGGGYYDGSGTGNGGAGGGTNGVDGVYGYSGCTNSYGRAGTQTAGGAKTLYCSSDYGSTAGSLGTGGAGTAYSDGGGGGGYYGGSGGEPYAGGGGGSGYVGGVTSSTSTAGSGVTPPNTGDSDYASGIGAGGSASGNGGNGRVVISYTASSSSVVTGHLGQALQFDGTDDNVTTSETSALTLGKVDFTTSAWFKFTATSFATPLAWRHATVSGNLKVQGLFSINRTTSSGKIDFETWAWQDASTIAYSTNALNDGQWHQAVAVYTLSDNNVRLYIDGVLNDTKNQGSTYSPDTGANYKIVLGSNVDGIQFFPGSLDDVRIYSRALSATEVKLLYNYTGAYNPVASPGKVKQAMYFDGTNDYVSVADAAALELGSGDFTIDLFAKFDDVASTRGLVSKWGATGGSTLSYALDWVTGTNQLRFHCSSDGAADTAYNQSFTPTVGGWYHITIVRSGSALRHYIDGVQVGSDLPISGGCFNSSRPLLIGATDNGGGSFYYHDGAIDEVRVYNRALTGSEITELGGARQVKINSSQNALVTDGLAGLWSFDGKDMSQPIAITATGGTITTSGAYTIHTFTSSGTFTVTSGSGNVEYLVVAGGGGGAVGPDSRNGGGGGGGGFRTGTLAVSSQSYSITVSAGGGAGSNGGGSIFSSITTTGGGAGGPAAGSSGGSGGGAGDNGAPSNNGGLGTSGQGSNGGNSCDGAGGGGGGGAGGVGGNGVCGNGIAGNGGPGLSSSISGSSVTYAGGGGGGRHPDYGGGAGGSGGGGSVGQNGSANTGGGGGGSYSGGTAGAGGSGIVIVRYLTTADAGISYDRSGNGKNGTLTNSPTPTIGKIGQALDFDGTNDYISVGNVGSVNSVSFWIKADNTTKKIIDLNGTQYVEVSAGTITATGFTSPTIYVDGAAASAIDTGWHHVVITTASTITASAVDIGRVSSGYFDGKLDDVRMYSRTLSASEIQTLYNGGN